MSDAHANKNRLAAEASPYLLLHQHNPVDWYPWGEEAIEKARVEDKPIFLSVGYSTCYWCHVMERESFSNSRMAELMNRHFVNIKVDREERPELDEIYMAATQVLAGQGGWPNSLFLTTELKPYFAGTYFPPEDRPGHPGFGRVLESMLDAWTNRRADVEEQAEGVAKAIRHYLAETAGPGSEPPRADVAERSLDDLRTRFDGAWGGFGGAPKFPTPSNLFLLGEFSGVAEDAAEMLATTLDHMGRGGIYDQIAGGFHRYATDQKWRVPHFEKMLYDNGLLLEIFARHWKRTGDADAARVIRGTAEFLERELTSPEGGFWSAIDAETDGDEGAYYVWKREELQEILGADDFAFIAPILGFEGAPFFDGGRYVLHLPRTIDQQAARRRMSRENLIEQMRLPIERLFATRNERPRPLTDDKILTDWNGTAICGLATAGRLMGEDRYVELAAGAVRFILESMWKEPGTLLHSWREGRLGVPGLLSDYVYLIRGLLALHRADRDGGWLDAAVALADEQEERLGDEWVGGYFAAAERPDVLVRSKEIYDGAVPASNAIAVLNLIDLHAQTGDDRWSEKAERSFHAFAEVVNGRPEAARTMALASWRYYSGGTSDAAAGELAPPAEDSASPQDVVDPQSALEQEALGVVAAVVSIEDRVEQEGWQPFRLQATVREGWHIYANQLGAVEGEPTELEVAGGQMRDLVYPHGRPIAPGMAIEPYRIYENVVEIRGEILADEGVETALELSYQACDDRRCLPRVTISLPLPTNR